MNKDKLDKLVDRILSEIGEIKELEWGEVYDQNGRLIATKTYDRFLLNDNVPHLKTLHNIMDQDSFEYVMNRVGNYISNKTTDPQPLKYKRKTPSTFLFYNIINERF